MPWINPRMWKWRWVGFQVAVPLLGPIVVSAIVALVWETGQPAFHMDVKVIFDVTPWALIFFTMALLGSGFNDIWADLGNHRVLAIFLVVDVFAVLLYASFIVIWRHNSAFVPGNGVYVVTIILLAASIMLCHSAARA